MLNNLDHTNRIHRTKCKLTNNNTAYADADDTKVSTFPNESQTRWLCRTGFPNREIRGLVSPESRSHISMYGTDVDVEACSRAA